MRWSARAASRLEDLPRGARLGTSSLRRQAQLLAARPDLRDRGAARQRRTRAAAAGRRRTGRDRAGLRGSRPARARNRASRARLDPEVSLPAVGQGVIGIECRDRRLGRARRRCAALDHAATRIAVDAERAFARRLGGSCQSPIAAHAQLEDGRVALAGTGGGARRIAAAARCVSGGASRARALGVGWPSACSPPAPARCSSGCARPEAMPRCTVSASWSPGPEHQAGAAVPPAEAEGAERLPPARDRHQAG